MAFSAAQIAVGVNYALATHQKKEPIDQINFQHVTLDWLIKNKEESSFLNGSFKEPLFIDNGSNAQNYAGADQVTYNERDPNRWTDFSYYSLHDGFWFDEDRLIAAGINISDEGAPTKQEKDALINLLQQSYRGLKKGMQKHLAFEMLRDGTQSAKACPGLSHIIDSTPATGTVGGIDAATSTYWRNNANLLITPANVITEMDETRNLCMRYGGKLPTFIPCGQAFYENYKVQAAAAIQRHQAVQGRGGSAMDPTIDAVNYHGVPLKWDPTFDELDTLLGTTTWTKTALFLNDAVKFRPLKGQWMRDRKPEKLPDRYVTYFAKTSKYGLTSDQRNALAIVSIS